MTHSISASSMAALCRHSNEDNATELSETIIDGETIILRICGVGDSAFFEYINDYGDPVSECLDEIDILSQWLNG